MKAKLSQILDAYNAIQQLDKLPYMVGWQMARVMRKLEPEVIDLNKAQQEMAAKYGKTLPNGDVEILPGNMPEFTQARNALLQQEIDIDIQPIKLSQFGTTYQVTPLVLHFLDWILLDDISQET